MSIGLRYTHLDDWNPLISFQVTVLWYFGTYIAYGKLFAVARLLLRGSSHSPKFPCFQRTWKNNPSPRLSSLKSRANSNKPPPEPVRRSPSRDLNPPPRPVHQLTPCNYPSPPPGSRKKNTQLRSPECTQSTTPSRTKHVPIQPPPSPSRISVPAAIVAAQIVVTAPSPIPRYQLG